MRRRRTGGSARGPQQRFGMEEKMENISEFQSCLRPAAFCQKPDRFHGGEYIPGQILRHSFRICPAYDGFANYCQSFFSHHYQYGRCLSCVFSSGFLLINDSKTGAEAAHFSFRYTKPAVFDIIKKNPACGILPAIEDCLRGGSRKRHLPFRRSAIHQRFLFNRK